MIKKGSTFRVARSFLVASTCLLLVTCNSPEDDDDILSFTIDSEKAGQGIFKTFISTTPDVGTESTIFLSTVNVLQDANRAVDYYARWDLDGDGIYDTGWLDSLTYTSSGQETYNVKVQVIDSESYSEVGSDTVHIVELMNITNNMDLNGQGNADLHPDGTRLIFEWRYPTSEHQIYEYNIVEGTTSLLIDATAHGPDYSYDGSLISIERGRMGIWVYNTLTTNVEEVVPDSLSLSYWCRWSPVENKFLYRGSQGMHIYDYDNTIDSVITAEYYYNYCWSPDGEYLALANHNGISTDTETLYILRLADLSIIKTFNNLHIGYKMDWSSDGNWICLGVEKPPIISVLNYSTEEVITLEPSPLIYPWYPSWSIDGTSLYFEGREEGTGLSIWNMGFPL
ncbi:MAG: WD40 repeat domain-containing protein [Candidatus Marinimicrobia bacterium]|nr:WD40 repeat domain-containing protein [Candidatus Neomarinimicrobiota bacterium]MBT3680295.1 WD40 repeat domain-containing protein [Candidatus Neomarinimicrobiota bacterium]MBT3951186.1 WD40 repeat domain-containing protein [Candidatus Neomarinimicrobiota bacterium]MBT4253625.1 WD40 repeat domain-containing protein [Candidatus Neomarinimicrobiota bacterium]MBT4481533.1 WD40 repeat domain-containing protein [Candidatus Neomarinimicrobiota bacterium]